MILNEDVTKIKINPETPPYHATEGTPDPDASLTFHYDIEGGGIPREAQRITSVDLNYGFDYLHDESGTSSLLQFGIDTCRSLLYELVRKNIRLSFLLDPDGGSYRPGFNVNGDGGVANFVSLSYLNASGSNSLTTTINQDFRSMSVGGVFVPYDYGTGAPAVWHSDNHAVNPGFDYAFTHGWGKDLSLITSCSVTDTGGTITTATPLSADQNGWVAIVKPSSFPSYPFLREDRTIWVERASTGWINKENEFDELDEEEGYRFSNKVIGYPLKWAYYTEQEGGGNKFEGTFQVFGSEDDSVDGTGVVDLTDLVLGDEPASRGSYDYTNFPGRNSPLRILNGPAAELNLLDVSIPPEINYIKIFFTEQVETPTQNSLDYCQISCAHNIKVPDNSALANYTGSGEILEVFTTDGYFCSKYKSIREDDLDGYPSTGLCNQSVCSQFEAWNSFIPTKEVFNNWWSGRGIYYEQIGTGRPTMVIGRNDFDGFLTYLGFPIYDSTGLFMSRREYTDHGAFSIDTGETDSNNYKIYRTWQQSVDNNETEIDNLGIFSLLSQYISKKDPAGGTA